MLPFISRIGAIGGATLFISLIVSIAIVDSQFINIFYGTELSYPGTLHLSLFILFVIAASVANVVLLLFLKSGDFPIVVNRGFLKIIYLTTSAVQYTIMLSLFIMIAQMLTLQEYSKILFLLITYLSHIWSSLVLGFLALRFIQWYRFSRSNSMLIYAIVFGVIIFLILISIPILTEQFKVQSEAIYPRDYSSLIFDVIIPSRDIAFIYGLGNYVLPIMLISSWILTVSMLRSYVPRVGKKVFWLIVGIPLVYQLVSFLIRDANLIIDPNLINIIYSKGFQFILNINYQVSGIFFAIAFLNVARKMKRKVMRNYLIISSIGIVLLFSSMQPGMPFYAAYPPFGTVTVFFLGLSAYLLLVGMLGIAAYVSRDNQLRREIYKDLQHESEMFKNMGIAEIQRNIERKVLPHANKIILSDEMKYHMDPSDEEIKAMISEVLSEIKSVRTKNGREFR